MTEEVQTIGGVTWGGSGGNYDTFEQGIHPARFGYIDDKVRTHEKKPNPYVFLKFESGGKEVPMSLDVGSELQYVIWQLTGKQIVIEGEHENTVLNAIRALRGCDWEGLVNVGRSGFIDRLQAPDDGGYKYMFGEWLTNGEDGLPGTYLKRNDAGDEYPRTTVLLIIDEGPYTGYQQICNFACSISGDRETGALVFKKSLVQFLKAAGMTPEIFAEEIKAGGGALAFFKDIENPLPEIEAILQRLAGEGKRLSGAIVDGWTPWGSLYPASDADMSKKSSPQQAVSKVGGIDDSKLRQQLQSLADRIWPKGDVEIFKANGDLTNYNDPERNDGMYLGKNVLKPMTEVVDGAISMWPPATYWDGGQQAVDEVCGILERLLDVGNDDLFLMVADSPKAKENLKGWIAGGSDDGQEL